MSDLSRVTRGERTFLLGLWLVENSWVKLSIFSFREPLITESVSNFIHILSSNPKHGLSL